MVDLTPRQITTILSHQTGTKEPETVKDKGKLLQELDKLAKRK